MNSGQVSRKVSYSLWCLATREYKWEIKLKYACRTIQKDYVLIIEPGNLYSLNDKQMSQAETASKATAVLLSKGGESLDCARTHSAESQTYFTNWNGHTTRLYGDDASCCSLWRAYKTCMSHIHIKRTMLSLAAMWMVESLSLKRQGSMQHLHERCYSLK